MANHRILRVSIFLYFYTNTQNYMKNQAKSKEELLYELQELEQKYNSLIALYDKDIVGGETIEDILPLLEAELKASEQRFKQVAESAGVWIWEVDANGLYTYSSPVVERILGYTPEEIVGKKHFYELFHSENAEETKKFAINLFGSKKAIRDLVNQNVHKNGRLVWLSTTGTPILDNEGNLLGYQGVDTDITERKISEEALRESEFFFKESQKAAFIGSYKTEFSKGYWESSEVLDQIFGIGKDYNRSIQGWIEIVHPEDRDMMSNYLNEEVISKRKPFNKEYRVVRKNDGQTRWVLGQGIGAFDDEGNILTLVGTIQDITERRLDDYKIRKLNKAVEATSELVFMTDEEGIITYINPAFTDVYGYTADDVIGKVTPRILKSGKLDSNSYKNFWEELLNKRVVSKEMVNKTKDGRHIYIEGSTNMILDEAGKNIGFIAIQKDITTRKQIEEELVQAKEQAEESDRLKSAFLANMSHEIRTPMNGILGFAELLKKPSLTSSELQEYIQAIQISGDRMLNTINSIVDVSRIESGLMNVDLGETNVNENLEFIYKFFSPECKNKGLKFTFETGLASNASIIKTDSEKVYGVLTNLVKNAIKFTHEGSIKFGYHKNGKELEFFVIDTGIGISKDQHDIIFERFRQGSDHYNRGYEGSGLGLSICKSYVEMLGGRIWVESKKGEGSKFFFTIPYDGLAEKDSTVSDSFTPEKDEATPENLKILIVEDDEISYSLLYKSLIDISKDIYHAKNGLEAIEACRRDPDIDLILMDIQLPVMNGYDATHQIRQFNKDIVIIAQTAFGLQGDREKAIQAGCNDYISKPIKVDQLLSLMQKYIAGQ